MITQLLTTQIIIFIGANDYSNNEYDLFAKAFYQAMVKLSNYVIPSNILVIMPLPRSKGITKHGTQMQEIATLENDLNDLGCKTINTYNALPEFMRKPKELFGKHEKDENAKHYSNEVKAEIHNMIATNIKLDLQHKWMKIKDPWCFTY